MNRHIWTAVFLAAGLSTMALGGWDLENGDFAEGTTCWITNWGIEGGAGVRIEDIDGNGQNDLVFDAEALTNQYTGVIAFQEISPRYLSYVQGIALRADVAVTNLPGDTGGDFKAFTKVEFLDQYSNVLNEATVSGQYDPSKHAASNQVRHSVALVANGSTLASNLAQSGHTWWSIKKIRTACFLYRFDTNTTLPAGQAYFSRVALGRVSELDYSISSVNNGDFEFDNWCWMENQYSSLSSTSGWSVADIDGDGDKEVRFEADDLSGQYAGRLWVQDFQAPAWNPCVVWTNDIILTADVGASNLTEGLRAFIKLEFGGPYSYSPSFAGVYVSSEDPSTAAMTNQVIQDMSVTMTYDNLTTLLANAGKSLNDIGYIRCVIFLMQFSETPPPPSGFAWYDNVRLDFQYTNTVRSPAVEYTTRMLDDQIELSWGNCESSSYYHVQRAILPDGKWSNVVENVWCGYANEILTNTIPIDGSGASYRVVKGPYMQPLE